MQGSADFLSINVNITTFKNYKQSVYEINNVYLLDNITRNPPQKTLYIYCHIHINTQKVGGPLHIIFYLNMMYSTIYIYQYFIQYIL